MKNSFTLKTKTSALYPSALILLAFLALASSAFGQSATWTSSGDTTWSTGANWSNAAGPGALAADRASFLTANGTASPNLTANATTGAVTFNGTYTLSSVDAATSLTLLGTGTGASSAIYNLAGNTTISAPIIFGAAGAQTINGAVGSILTISGPVSKSDATALNFTGGGTMVLSGSNSFAGAVFAGGGTGTTSLSVASIGNSGANSNLGTNGTIHLGSTTLVGKVIYTGAGETTNKVINLAGTTGGAAIQSDNSSGLLKFTSNATATGVGIKTLSLLGTGNAEFAGNIVDSSSGATSLIKNDPGIWTLSGGNTYSGNTTLTAGTLIVGNKNAFGTGVFLFTGAAGTTLQASADLSGANAIANTWSLGPNSVTISGSSNITLSGAFLGIGGNRTLTNSMTGGAALVMSGDFSLSNSATTRIFTLGGSGNTTISGNITNGGGSTGSGLTITNTGVTTLSGSNSHSGNTTVSAGTLIAGNKDAFGTGALSLANTTLQASADLSGANAIANASSMTDSITISGSNNITLSGAFGVSTTGTRNITNNMTVGATLVMSGNLSLSSSATNIITTLAGSGNTIISGNITNGASTASGLTITNTGVTTLSGTNSYTGNTTVSAGTLVFLNTAAKASGNVTAGASARIGLGVGGSGDYTDANVAALFNTTLIGFTMNATSGVAIDTTGGNFTQSTALTASRSLTKLGANTLTLAGTNTYTGATIVSVGTLLINGSTSSSSTVTVASGATLGGSGTVGGATTVAAGATLSPGNSPGNLTFNNGLTLLGTYKWELAALSTASPGTNFDMITVAAGNVDITGATMNLTLGGFAPTNVAFWNTNQTWTGIINNTGGGSLTGTFGAIDNSSWAAIGAFTTANVGNDVNLVWTAVPEPATWVLTALGLTVVVVFRRRRA